MKKPALILLVSALASLSAAPRGLTSREIVIEDAVVVVQPEAVLTIPAPAPANPGSGLRENWCPLLEMSLGFVLPAGEQFGIYFDNKEQFANPYFTGGSVVNESHYRQAVAKAPTWIQAELHKTLLQLDYYPRMHFSTLIINAPDPIVDEIAFCVATASPQYLNSSFAYPELFTENAEWIYSVASQLPYVEIVDVGSAATGGDYYSTTRYWKKDANGQFQQVTVPREIYYWYLVNPKITDEIQAYIDPNIVENNSTHSNNIAAPWNGGKFWRSYFYDFDDDAHPVLCDTLTQCPSVFNRDGSPGDAIRAITWWINQNMSFTSNNERPHQPVRIFAKRFGRCGEYADFSSAVARTALIPCTNISSVSTDHTWNEFWEDGWVSWEPVNGYLNNPLVYENGWGRVFGSVFEERSDGLFSPVTERYSEGVATINIQVVDQDMQPVDAARVVLAIFESSPRFDCEAYTDNNGMVSFKVGENRDYRARTETMFGQYPAIPGTYTQLVANTVNGETYNYQFQIAAPMPQPTIEALATPPDPEQDYRFTVDFQSLGYFVTGRTLWDDIDVLGAPARYYQHVDDPSTVSFLVVDADNAIFLDLDNFCSAYSYTGPVASGNAVFDIPAGQNWYALLDNSQRHGNAVLLSGTLAFEYWNTAVSDPQLPAAVFSLDAIAPNPFSEKTRVGLQLKEPAEMGLSIYNLRGEKVREFGAQKLSSGQQWLEWDGRNDHAEALPSGVYFLKASAGKDVQVRKLLLLK